MAVSVAQAQIFFLALTRILAVLIQVPVLGGRQIPNQVKLGFGVLLAIVLIPWEMLPPEAPSMPTYGFALAAGKEVVVGSLIGLAAMLTFGVFEIAGNMIGIGSGFEASKTINPLANQSVSAIGQLFYMTAMLFFFVLDGHHLFLAALQRTFEMVPLTAPIPQVEINSLLLMAAQLVVAGIHMALPVFGALLLTDLSLALLARVAPTIHVFFLGIPIKVGVGLIALALALEFMVPGIGRLFEQLPERMLSLVN